MLLTEIKKKLKAESSVEFAEQMKKVAPGATKIYGIKMPVLNELAKACKQGGFDLVSALWQSGAYEERILAAKTIRLLARQDPDYAIALVKKFSVDIDNWAVCDTLGMQSLKTINKIRSKEIFLLATEFSTSKFMWQRRLSLVLVEDFCKQKEFHPAIIQLIVKQKSDKEYYIKRAVAWLEASLNKHI